jgi:hypothetical protein
MKKFTLAAFAALAVSAAPAFAADMPVKAAPMVAPPPPAWDIAFGSAIASDYIWRGITQSNHHGSVAVYFEPRYNINANLQLYSGIGGASIDFPNRAAAEIDFYAGVRPTFGKLALDLGVWYYFYPGGTTFAGFAPPGDCTNGADLAFVACNTAKADASFLEVYARAMYTVNDMIAIGGNFYYTGDYLNTGADGTYASGTVKFTAPSTMLPNGVGAYLSGEVGSQWLGTTDAFYGTIPLPDYVTWNVGVGFTWKVFTLDLRYIDTDLTEGECNVLTGAHTATFNAADTTPNNNGNVTNWCDARFVARLSADLTVNSNVK